MSRLEITYIGDDTADCPAFVEVAGTRFTLNKPVTVDNSNGVFAKIRTNRFFVCREVDPAAAPPPAAPVDAPAQARPQPIPTPDVFKPAGTAKPVPEGFKEQMAGRPLPIPTPKSGG